MSINTNNATDQLVATTGTLTVVNSGTLTFPTTTDTLVGQSGTVTLTNKRVTPRIISTTTSGAVTPTSDTADQYEIIATGTLSIGVPNGTLTTDGQKMLIRIKNNGTVTSQAITWTTTTSNTLATAGFRVIGVTLPTATPSNATTGVQYVGCIYNSSDFFWDVVAVGTL